MTRIITRAAIGSILAAASIGFLPARADSVQGGLYEWRAEGDAIYIYNHTDRQVICHVEYDTSNGMGGLSGDSRSVVVRPNSKQDAGVGGMIVNFAIRDCHPWSIQHPQG